MMAADLHYSPTKEVYMNFPGRISRWIPGWFKPRDPNNEVPIKEVAKILGKDLVLPDKTVGKALGIKKFSVPYNPYSREVFEMCAEQNALKTNWEWVFFAKPGKSFVELKGLFPKEFSQGLVWKDPPDWFAQSSDPGYRLINLKAELSGSCLKDRSHLFEIDARIRPVYLQTMAELMITWKRVRNEYLLRDDHYHCGEPIGDYMPIIGDYTHSGMLISMLPLEFVQAFALPKHGVITCLTPLMLHNKNPA